VQYLVIKKNKFITSVKIFFSILYGYLNVKSLELDYINESGDIGMLLHNVQFKIHSTVFTYESLFYYIVNFLQLIFNVDYFIVFKIITFTISFILFLIFFLNIKTKSNFTSQLLLLILVFLTPLVYNLFVSGLRSGIAFLIFFYAITYSKSYVKYILLTLSIFFHLSMIPLIYFYFIFNLLNKTKLNFSKSFYFVTLILNTFFIIFFSNIIYDLSTVAQSLTYKVFVLTLVMIILFLNSNVVKNIYGFISIGLFLVVLVGFFFDLSFIRYLGNALLLYVFFLLRQNNNRSIKLFLISYLPFFILLTLYSIPAIR